MPSNLPRPLRFDQERLHFTSGAVTNLRLDLGGRGRLRHGPEADIPDARLSVAAVS